MKQKDLMQCPAPDAQVLRWKGDVLAVSLRLSGRRAGRAVFRTDFGGTWHDLPMAETSPGFFTVSVPLDKVGVFAGKACFFPKGSTTPVWPAGGNFRFKVAPAVTRRGNSIYTVFPRQFGGARFVNPENEAGVRDAEAFLDQKGFTVIPPSGTFRDVVRQLPHIMDDMGFRIVQLLPIFPVPTTFARMGRYGCPFAATDFLSVDPAYVAFDPAVPPLGQFRELADAVHARGGSLFIDLPANHTGWAATLQTHHPDWYRTAPDGRFISPGAWGVTWEDLVELDYSHAPLREYMADVFLFWCRQGVDGFRCDAGYMIPADVWTFIVDRVRAEYPDTVFMLEGLGGELSVTDDLLAKAGLDWAYSEIFQTYDRGAFEWYLPDAIRRAETYGALVHFAETHDNDRLAKRGPVYARLRVQLAALLSHQGAWGITNGVEWYATEKVDVHGASALNWDAPDNMVSLIGRLNGLLETHAVFSAGGHEEVITRGDGNTLAVVRTHPDVTAPVLVLANLDCEKACTVKWAAESFPAGTAVDLLTGRTWTADPHQGIPLAPGEVLCLEKPGARRTARTERAEADVDPENGTAVAWTWPTDIRRTVCVPDGCRLRVRAPHAFRVRLTDGVRTLATARSTGDAVTLAVPTYDGDGTRGVAHRLEMTVYTPEAVRHDAADVLILPPAAAARVKTVYTGDEVRADNALETILGDGAGSMSRVKLAWGTLRSQYDALFAANPNPCVPADRLALWTRCRAWLQYEGYSHAIDAETVESVRVDPAGRFARWIFRVPCGMGLTARFAFTLSLSNHDGPSAYLAIRRLAGGTVAAPVRIVLRPDLEWRSFHAVTKAHGAVEQAFAAPGAITCLPPGAGAGGFRFRPYEPEAALTMAVRGGCFYPETEWTYSVPHPEEAERGQEPCGDLFSPGWIACDFAAPDSAVTVTASYGSPHAPVPAAAEPPAVDDTADAVAFPEALRAALDLFVVRRDDVKTVLAGYPWFLDWGRDTFIFLRGAIAAGCTEAARAIVIAFARFEERGTLPNIIYGETAGNRDTTDAPLWFLVAVRDLCAQLGRKAFLATDCGGGRTLGDVVESILSHYADGTPNGIRVDPASGLVWSPSHFTWMDTNYPACTPRTGYPVEIQALWIAALRFAGGAWRRLAEKAERSLMTYFANENGLADCLDAPNGEPAAQGVRDDAIRPNQLFALSLDAVTDVPTAKRMLAACARLLVPGGVRSLADGHPLYKGAYTGDEDTRRKPAYHNGTVWAWPFPLYAEAAARYGVLTRDQALSLLASSVENLNGGCVCHVSEIADGDAPHAQKGCRAQAWSVSELLRVWQALSARHF